MAQATRRIARPTSLHAICMVGIALTAPLAGGCGEEKPEGLPSGAAARFGDTVIQQSDVDRYAKASMTEAGLDPTGYGPPEYSVCMAQKREITRKQGVDRPESNLKRQCRYEYGIKVAQALGFLLRAKWLDEYASDTSIVASNASLERQLANASSGLPTDGDHERGSSRWRLTKADNLRRMRVALLEERLLARTRVTDAEVALAYKKSTNQFRQPERRDVRLVLARTRMDAIAARRSLARGATWASIVKRYSTDEASRATGGETTLLASSAAADRFTRAAFAADDKTIRGPVRTQHGWFVWELDKITPAEQSPLAEVSDAIRSRLRFNKREYTLYERYAETTRCAARYVIPEVAECFDKPLRPPQRGIL